MEQATLKEANTNFSKLARMADEKGIIAITRHGKERYVLMTMEKYEGKSDFEAKMEKDLEKGIWIDETEEARKNKQSKGFQDSGKTITRVLAQGDNVQVLRMHFHKGENSPEHCTELILPKSQTKILEGPPIKILSNEMQGVKFASIDLAIPPEDPPEKRVHKLAAEAAKELSSKPEFTEVVFEGFPLIKA